MTRPLPMPIGLLLVAGFGLLGYKAADLWEKHRAWRGDREEVAALLSTTKGIGAKLEPFHLEPTPSRAAIEGGVAFEDAAHKMGLDFIYNDGAAGEYFIYEAMGGGMAVLDFDLDGSQDLLMVSGCRLPVDPRQRETFSRLFRRQSASTDAPDGRFEDVTEPSGLFAPLYGQGASAADFNNDGFDDVLVTGFGKSLLFRNQGDGTFKDVTVESGMAAALATRWGTSAAWSDLDGDGALDLYVCTYADVDLDHPLICSREGIRSQCPPAKYRPQIDLLFLNRGDGTFLEAAKECGVDDAGGRGMGIVIANLTESGKPDIFIANDTSEAYLFVRDGKTPSGLPRFRNRAVDFGVASNGDGAVMAGMGVACADYNQDNRLDLYLTDFYGARSALFVNRGAGGFADEAQAAGVAAPSRSKLGFGAVFLDADLDGWPDLFVANGHVNNLTALGLPYKMRAQFFRNRGDGSFADVSDGAGPYFRQLWLGRGTAVADFNDDGRPDVIVGNIRDPAALLLNRTATAGHWLGVELIGARWNRTALNVPVAIVRKGVERRFETISGAGYLSSSDHRLLIGLGNDAVVDELIVRWPSGVEQRVARPAFDRYHRLVEPLE